MSKTVKVEVIDPFFIDGEPQEVGAILELDADTALTLASANRVKVANLSEVKAKRARGE